MQILIFGPAGKSFSVNETCEFLNYSFFKKLFSAILIHGTKLSSEGSGAFEEGAWSWADPGVLSHGGLDAAPIPGHHLPLNFLCLRLWAALSLLNCSWENWSLVIGIDSSGGNSEVVLLSPSLTDVTTFTRVPGHWEPEKGHCNPLKNCKDQRNIGDKSIANPRISLPVSLSFLI